jgi:hypothetical protein
MTPHARTSSATASDAEQQAQTNGDQRYDRGGPALTAVASAGIVDDARLDIGGALIDLGLGR